MPDLTSPLTPPPAPFLATDAYIDADHADIRALAASLAAGTPEASAQRCYEWVRDHILHSIDFEREEIPCVASQVLATGSALCIGKSHLLVALLRALNIPAGLCYQRLTFGEDGPPFCMHAMVGVWLDGHGWYRCDARGNTKPGIACEFTPGRENLAYAPRVQGEYLFPHVWAQPWPNLMQKMAALNTATQYCANPADSMPPAVPHCVVPLR